MEERGGVETHKERRDVFPFIILEVKSEKKFHLPEFFFQISLYRF